MTCIVIPILLWLVKGYEPFTNHNRTRLTYKCNTCDIPLIKGEACDIPHRQKPLRVGQTNVGPRNVASRDEEDCLRMTVCC